ncbi:MAG: hypothetical protein NZL90_03315 [Aquificaceae bacterium]|nr:hypothetical protein [Aquificaceae bacterium]MDW8237681.1 hypothetical protein [Aquificaceae bacterium]
MRFFISAKIRQNPVLHASVIAFVIFSLLHWLFSWFYFYSKYGFSKERLISYYFLDPIEPQRPSLAQLSEDMHVSLFVNFMLIIVLLSILATVSRLKFAVFVSVFVSILAGLYILSDIAIYAFGPQAVIAKLIFFVLYQLSLAIAIAFVGFKVSFEDSIPPKTEFLKLIVGIFAIFSIVFLLVSALNFFLKMGFSAQGVKNYYLGNSELFLKPKSMEGIMKVFYPHIIAMAIYSLSLSHLLAFTKLSKFIALTIGIVVFLFSFLDNLSSILILLSGAFAYLKLISFAVFETFALFGSLALLWSILRA